MQQLHTGLDCSQIERIQLGADFAFAFNCYWRTYLFDSQRFAFFIGLLHTPIEAYKILETAEYISFQSYHSPV